MFVKTATTRPRHCVKLVAAFRGIARVSRQQVIATLGQLEAVRTANNADLFVDGLPRVTGVSPLVESIGGVTIVSALLVGATWLLSAH